MVRLKLFITGLLATFLLASVALAQEETRHEVSVQGIGFITKDSNQNGIRQHTTDSGGVLTSYRFHFNRWLAADGTYGYTRNTWQTFTATNAFNLQANTHQTTAALVVTSPRTFAGVRPYALAGGGALTFAPTSEVAIPSLRLDRQTTGVFVYGGGADINLTRHFALRGEYRGLVYKRPDFVSPSLNINPTTHTAQPSLGFVIRF